MSRQLNANEIREKYMKLMGDKRGEIFAHLWQECSQLHMVWAEYVCLYGTNQGRFELMNQSAPMFFSSMQDILWEYVLLNLACFSDPSKTGKKENLSLAGIQDLLEDSIARTAKPLLDGVSEKCEFARDWRNKHIAHKDLGRVLNKEALAPATRLKVKESLSAITKYLDCIQMHYEGATTYYDRWAESPPATGALGLLYVISDGIEAEKARSERIKNGSYTHADIHRKRDI